MAPVSHPASHMSVTRASGLTTAISRRAGNTVHSLSPGSIAARCLRHRQFVLSRLEVMLIVSPSSFEMRSY